MVEILGKSEAVPSNYPNTPTGLSTGAQALEPSMIWARIEAWISWRWTERELVWVIQGPGDWKPDLAPATVSTVQAWDADSGWAETTGLKASALGGYVLPGVGSYRFTATVGGGNVPEDVKEAYRRLAEWMAEPEPKPGASHFTTTVGPIEQTATRRANWKARALHDSGAADLLRRYRRA
ncbi:hypothetical protein FIU97_09420 [Roseivivax sp. THAF40]|uniref:hypothetical protein n=1 Tax=Roseivivax sp. THAF40 TaxID=2587858 RepID=UPI001267DCC0|nr:hypothetical protein [Roseivivax sp. THAF40]QFT46790.1 hypothetical protein FIU97_09420 [Roseivivax sp. THAF40]